MNDYVPPFTSENRASTSAQLQEIVTSLVASFHAQNFIHGDIRDSNFLVHMGGEPEIKLGGKEGEVHYLVLINIHTVHHPLGVFGVSLSRQTMIC